jgi:hypothetical protein
MNAISRIQNPAYSTPGAARPPTGVEGSAGVSRVPQLPQNCAPAVSAAPQAGQNVCKVILIEKRRASGEVTGPSTNAHDQSLGDIVVQAALLRRYTDHCEARKQRHEGD